MKRLNGLILGVIAIPLWINISEAGLEVNRVWVKSHGYGHVLVTYTNDDDQSYDYVLVKCVAYNIEGKKVTEKDTLFGNVLMPKLIHPGHSETNELMINLDGETMGSASCKIALKK